jgi:hypothetical protein
MSPAVGVQGAVRVRRRRALREHSILGAIDRPGCAAGARGDRLAVRPAGLRACWRGPGRYARAAPRVIQGTREPRLRTIEVEVLARRGAPAERRARARVARGTASRRVEEAAGVRPDGRARCVNRAAVLPVPLADRARVEGIARAVRQSVRLRARGDHHALGDGSPGAIRMCPAGSAELRAILYRAGG